MRPFQTKLKKGKVRNELRYSFFVTLRCTRATAAFSLDRFAVFHSFCSRVITCVVPFELFCLKLALHIRYSLFVGPGGRKAAVPREPALNAKSVGNRRSFTRTTRVTKLRGNVHFPKGLNRWWFL
jgi:hypothetical protein